jgi:hypothetical protein
MGGMGVFYRRDAEDGAESAEEIKKNRSYISAFSAASLRLCGEISRFIRLRSSRADGRS